MSENDDLSRRDVPAHGWPAWLTDLGPGMDILIGAIERHRKELFDKHEDRPCGSGKHVKYCCGQ